MDPTGLANAEDWLTADETGSFSRSAQGSVRARERQEHRVDVEANPDQYLPGARDRAREQHPWLSLNETDEENRLLLEWEASGVSSLEEFLGIHGFGIFQHESENYPSIKPLDIIYSNNELRANLDLMAVVLGTRGVRPRPGRVAAASGAADDLAVTVPTVAELRAFNPSSSGLQTHHALPQYLGRQLGYTTAEMSGHPGILIPQFTHTGAANAQAIHKVISANLPVGRSYTSAQIRQGLSAAYSELGMPQLYKAIEHLLW